MQLGFDYILAVFFAGVAAVFAVTWLVSGARGGERCAGVEAGRGPELTAQRSLRSRPARPSPRGAGTKKHLSRGDRVVACWFMVTGLIHLVIEGEALGASPCLAVPQAGQSRWGPSCGWGGGAAASAACVW